jgi:HEPN domain-containing protein
MAAKNFLTAWLEKAAEDLNTVEILWDEDGPNTVICFHCQQCAEKALKSFLVAQKKEPPKTHDLEKLLSLATEIDVDFKDYAPECASLTRFYFEVRYPGDHFLHFSRQDAKRAKEHAESVYKFVKEKIGKKLKDEVGK